MRSNLNVVENKPFYNLIFHTFFYSVQKQILMETIRIYLIVFEWPDPV